MNSSVKLSGSLADKSKIRIERKHMKKKAGVTRPIQMSRSDKEIALDTAIELAEGRLHLIKMRDIEERDGVEEAKLKMTLKVLHNAWKAHKEDRIEAILDDGINKINTRLLTMEEEILKELERTK